jgi:hypothetical protein
MADDTNTNDFAAMMKMFAHKVRGDHTVLTIAAPFSDDQGNFEVALIEENGQPVWELTRCNVNDPQQWRAERYDWFGELKTESD